MEEERAIVEGPGYRLEVVRGFRNPVVGDGLIRVGDYILELDARISMIGESIAALLLPPITFISGDRAWFEGLLNRYRLRVVMEQAYDLATRSGRLIELLEIPLPYLPLSRMSQFKSMYSCIFNRFASREGLKELEGEYRDLAVKSGILSGDRVSIRPVRVRDYLASLIKSATLPLSATAATFTFKPPNRFSACDYEELLDKPWMLLRLPEGGFTLECRGAPDLAGEVLGGDASCSPPTLISSSVKCSAGEGVVVVKEYSRMYLKWIPTYIAGYTRYRYRVSPKSRLAAEYHYLRALRRVIRTPKIYVVCVDYYSGRMVREYIEGLPVLESSEPLHWRRAGEVLAEIHNMGVSLGDPNPGNFIATGQDELALIDAEQARPATLKAMSWDLGVFAMYSLIMNRDRKLVAEAFKGYRAKSRRAGEVISQLRRDTFWAQFMLLPHIVSRIKSIAKEALENS